VKTKLTLQEKLRDLRDEKKLTLSDLAGATGIPLSTLQRAEGQDDVRVGYQDITALAKFYGVSTDYLFGLTDNRQHRDMEIAKLNLSDMAITELTSGKLNTRLLSEIIAHPDFAELLAAVEVFVDRTISDNMEIINKTYKVALDTINRQAVNVGRDEYIAQLKEASIDPDDYLRFRLSQRFEKIAQSIYDKQHKKGQSEAGIGYIESLSKQVEKYEDVKNKTGSAEQAKLEILADQMGVDLKATPDNERKSVLSFLGRSIFKRGRKRR